MHPRHRLVSLLLLLQLLQRPLLLRYLLLPKLRPLRACLVPSPKWVSVASRNRHPLPLNNQHLKVPQQVLPLPLLPTRRLEQSKWPLPLQSKCSSLLRGANSRLQHPPLLLLPPLLLPVALLPLHNLLLPRPPLPPKAPSDLVPHPRELSVSEPLRPSLNPLLLQLLRRQLRLTHNQLPNNQCNKDNNQLQNKLVGGEDPALEPSQLGSQVSNKRHRKLKQPPKLLLRLDLRSQLGLALVLDSANSKPRNLPLDLMLVDLAPSRLNNNKALPNRLDLEAHKLVSNNNKPELDGCNADRLPSPRLLPLLLPPLPHLDLDLHKLAQAVVAGRNLDSATPSLAALNSPLNKAQAVVAASDSALNLAQALHSLQLLNRLVDCPLHLVVDSPERALEVDSPATHPLVVAGLKATKRPPWVVATTQVRAGNVRDADLAE